MKTICSGLLGQPINLGFCEMITRIVAYPSHHTISENEQNNANILSNQHSLTHTSTKPVLRK